MTKHEIPAKHCCDECCSKRDSPLVGYIHCDNSHSDHYCHLLWGSHVACESFVEQTMEGQDFFDGDG